MQEGVVEKGSECLCEGVAVTVDPPVFGRFAAGARPSLGNGHSILVRWPGNLIRYYRDCYFSILELIYRNLTLTFVMVWNKTGHYPQRTVCASRLIRMVFETRQTGWRPTRSLDLIPRKGAIIAQILEELPERPDFYLVSTLGNQVIVYLKYVYFTWGKKTTVASPAPSYFSIRWKNLIGDELFYFTS